MSISIKRIVLLVLISTLISNCAITPRQIKSQNRIVEATRICVATFQDEISWYNQYPYKGINTYHSLEKQNFSEKVFNDFKAIKEKYPEEWEKFKTRRRSGNHLFKNRGDLWDFWNGSLFTVFTMGLFPFLYVLSIPEVGNQDIQRTYPELLTYCDKRMDDELKRSAHKEILDSLQRIKNEQDRKEEELSLKEEEKNAKISQTKIKKILRSKNFVGYIDGISIAIDQIYSSPNSNFFKNKLIIFNRGSGRENGLSVISIQGEYVIYSNKSFLIAVKKLSNKPYLKNSLLSGSYFRFVGTRMFNNENGSKDELVVFEEIADLEAFNPFMIKSIMN